MAELLQLREDILYPRAAGENALQHARELGICIEIVMNVPAKDDELLQSARDAQYENEDFEYHFQDMKWA